MNRLLANKLRIAAVLLVAAMLLSACSKPSAGSKPAAGDQGAGTYDPNGALTFVTTSDPTFNPWSPNAYQESNLINEMLFPGLTRWDKEYKPEADLATEWSTSPDGLTWTFKLREGVTWTDGQPFTADDVAFTFNNIVLDKKLGANGRSNYTAVDHVVAVDPLTVQFILKKPFAALPAYLAYYSGILPKHVFEGVTDPWKLTEFNKKNPIGTGPYKVSQYSEGAYLTLVPNDKYWGGKPKLKSITFKIVPDPNAQVAQMLAGDVDMIGLSDPAVLDRFKGNSKFDVIAQTQNIYYFIFLNQKDARFQDARVRQALLYAVDREAMIKNILKGYGTIATGPIAPIQKAYYDPEVQQYPYDPGKAKQLLADAGWTPGPDGTLQKDGKTLVINMPTAQYQQLTPITLLVQQYWQAIGVKAVIKSMDWNSWIKQVVVNRDYEGSVAWWSTPTDPDVLPYYASDAAEKGSNIPGYKNPMLDQILEQGRAAKTQAERVQIYRQAQELMAQELPYLYLWYPQILTVRSAKIGGMLEAGQSAAFAHAVDFYVKR
ncbi:MAG: ABC transporter substrate-binding protein [Firmicutes bacterium]|nr:ABC transporter substrate-binding protein [Bacillota bacterium]